MGAAWAAETKARTERASRRIGRVFDGKRNSAAVAANVRAVQEALDGLHIGLSIFDGALRLVACNRTFLTMLDFPAALGVAGTPLEAFVRLNTERGNNGPCLNGGDVEDVVRRRLAEAGKFEPGAFTQTLSDGTVIEVVRQPLPSGGVVSTYTDVTEITRAREVLEEKEREMTRYFEDIEMQRAMVEQQAQQMVHMAEDLALRNKEIEKSRAESDFQAKHDELTGLPNRRYFIAYLEPVRGLAGPGKAHKDRKSVV